MMKWIWGVYLTYAAWEDWKSREVSLIFLCFAAGLGFWNLYLCRDCTHLAAAGIGMCMLVFSKMTRGALGEGDGWFFLVSACYLDFREVLCLLLGSMGIGSVWGMALLLYGQWSGQRRMADATIPFLTCAWPVGLWLITR